MNNPPTNAIDASKAAAKDAADMLKCCGLRDKSEERSMTIQFLVDHLKNNGCPIPPYKEFVNCVKCPSMMAGAFGMNVEELKKDGADVGKLLKSNKRIKAAAPVTATPKPSIVLCSNAAFSYDFVEETITHELIHAIDICRVKLPKDDNGQWSSCRQIACSEIRASNLSGECRWGKEVWRGNGLKIGGQQMACVKRRANLSMQAHEKCKERSEQIIESVFDVCYRDTFPFHHHPDA